MTGAACGAGNAYPSRAPDFTPVLYGVYVVSFPDICLYVLCFVSVVWTYEFCLKDCFNGVELAD